VSAVLEELKYHDPSHRDRLARMVAERCGATIPTDLMMLSADLRRLNEAGMEIGGHTAGHPILASVSASAARAEIEKGSRRIEAITGQVVRLFAYPNGRPRKDYGPDHVRLVRSLGFEAAVTTAPGVAGKGSDVFQLPRFTPWDRSPKRFVVRLLRNCMETRPMAVTD